MTIQLYIHCFIAALIGLGLQVSVKFVSMQKKAKLSNLEFSVRQYIVDDKWVLIANVLSIVAILYVIDEFLNMDSRVMDYVKSGFLFVGYTGSDLILRFFSVANNKLNRAIDYKTTIADTQTGTLEKPTPAT